MVVVRLFVVGCVLWFVVFLIVGVYDVFSVVKVVDLYVVYMSM